VAERGGVGVRSVRSRRTLGACSSNSGGTPANAPGTECTYIDTRPAFDGHEDDGILSDHVHPNAAGSQVIADLTWKAMQAHRVGQ
jgi:lysophospholipase L1-like esterase